MLTWWEVVMAGTMREVGTMREIVWFADV